MATIKQVAAMPTIEAPAPRPQPQPLQQGANISTGTDNFETIKRGEPLDRVADYLHPRPATLRNNGALKSHGPSGIIKSAVSGSWLQTSDTASGQDALKSIFDENVNMAIINALMMTIMIPLMMENAHDWIEESFAGSSTAFADGWLKEYYSEEDMADLAKCFGDMHLAIYFISGVSFTMATLAGVYVLLCVNELGCARGVVAWEKQIGIRIRLPYWFFTIGIVVFVVPILMRVLLSMKSLPAAVILLLVVLLLVTLFMYGWYGWIGKLLAVSDQMNSYGDLVLTPSEIVEDVCAYLDHEHLVDSCEECLCALQGVTPQGLQIPLASRTISRVKMEYYKQRALGLGLTVSTEKLIELCFQ